VNIKIIELQRELLLNQLMEVETQLNELGIKRNKKGYTLFIRNGLYYVKYTDLQTGKQIPTNRCLKTADRKEAEKEAVMCRESYIKSYYDKKTGIKDIIKLFGEYYNLEKTGYLQEVLKRNERKMREKNIKLYNGFIHNYFLPFLNENKITKINEITIQCLRAFQSYLIDKGISPQTINDRIACAIKPIFNNLLLKGVIKQTPFIENAKFNLPESETRHRRHILTIYETLMALWDKEIWKLYKTKEDIKIDKIANPDHYKKYRLLCLLTATCGLRDAEVFMLRKENIIKIRRANFLNVVNSRIDKTGVKTIAGKRKVPIPTITYNALQEYIEENNITDYLFYTGGKTIQYNNFWFAKNQFGCHCGLNEKELKDRHFDFYSFRHFYKTMLNRSNIKDDIIEYFMGHKVDFSKVNENYNSIEDLDDEFFQTIGLKVVKYIDKQFQKAIEKYEALPIHTNIEEVSLSNAKRQAKTFYTNVLNKVDFADEIDYFIEDFYDKGFLSGNNKETLLNELKELFENGIIDEEKYGDAVYHIKNNVVFE